MQSISTFYIKKALISKQSALWVLGLRAGRSGLDWGHPTTILYLRLFIITRTV